MLRISISPLVFSVALMISPVALAAAECTEICRAYVACVEEVYPGASTEAQKRTMQEGCLSGCQSKPDSANSCYENADGQAGAVASCDVFSACILNMN